MLKVPGDDAVEFPLPILAAFDGSPTHVGRCVSVQPLLAEHSEECGEERHGKTSVQQGLDLDDRVRRAGPVGERRDFIAKSGVVNLVDEDAEESGRFFVWVRLELGVEVDDEGGGDGGEQTSL